MRASSDQTVIRAANRVAANLERENERLRDTLREIGELPFTMVNDADSLRHTIRAMQSIANRALQS